MSILYENNGSEYLKWNSGANTFLMYEDLEKWKKIPVQVQCQFGDTGVTEYAFLDTGAFWSTLSKETLEITGMYDSSRKKDQTYWVRRNELYGYLEQMTVFILSDDKWGEDLSVTSTFFVTDEHYGPNVIGYNGMLDHIKFALQPSIKVGQDNLFLFARSG